MLKVIQNIKLELHRGLKVNTSDPYSYGSKLKRKMKGALNWTLGSSNLSPRCSSTFIKNQRNLRLVGVASSTALILIIALALLPVSSKPKTAEAASGTSSSTTLTIVKASADLDLTTIASSGTFATSSASEMASFNVKTTNYTGYTLTISASDNTGTLTNTTSTGSFSSISGVVDEKTFDDSSYNGKWGYKPSKYNSTENVGFWPSPGTTATTLDVTKAPNPTTANEYTIALGARAAYTQPTGTYTKTTILTTTANPSPYNITYLDNTSDSTVKNLPDATGSTTTATSITLSSVTPSRTGYVFNGWCDVAPTNSGQTCSGTTYSAGGVYPIDQTTSNVITLYATWEIPEYDITVKPGAGISSVSLNGQNCTDPSGCTVLGLVYGQPYTLTATASTGNTFSAWYVDGAGNVSSPTSASANFVVGEGVATITANSTTSLTPPTTVMQNFTKSMCETYAKNGIQLTDSRDDRLYTVRWINSNCWMTDNLAFGANRTNPNTTTITIDQTSTNIDTSKTLTLYDIATYGTSGQVCNTYNYDSTTGTASGDGFAYLCVHTSEQADSVWYNYAAATAGTVTSTNANGNKNTNEAEYSLCPAGWRLPNKNEFDGIVSFVSVFSPVYGGSYYDGTHNALPYGSWWTSTAFNGADRYLMDFNLGSLSLNHYRRGVGLYIRCVRNS